MGGVVGCDVEVEEGERREGVALRRHQEPNANFIRPLTPGDSTPFPRVNSLLHILTPVVSIFHHAHPFNSRLSILHPRHPGTAHHSSFHPVFKASSSSHLDLFAYVFYYSLLPLRSRTSSASHPISSVIAARPTISTLRASISALTIARFLNLLCYSVVNPPGVVAFERLGVWVLGVSLVSLGCAWW